MNPDIRCRGSHPIPSSMCQLTSRIIRRKATLSDISSTYAASQDFLAPQTRNPVIPQPAPTGTPIGGVEVDDGDPRSARRIGSDLSDTKRHKPETPKFASLWSIPSPALTDAKRRKPTEWGSPWGLVIEFSLGLGHLTLELLQQGGVRTPSESRIPNHATRILHYCNMSKNGTAKTHRSLLPPSTNCPAAQARPNSRDAQSHAAPANANHFCISRFSSREGV